MDLMLRYIELTVFHHNSSVMMAPLARLWHVGRLCYCYLGERKEGKRIAAGSNGQRK
jgi:hypothetical protein